MKKLRAAVVGLRMGQAHVGGFASNPELFDLVALCDLNSELANDVAKKRNVPRVYADYDEMLAKEKLDAVAIATPTQLHCGMTVKAARAGARGIYCEKPIALSMGEMREMRTACEASRCALVVGHQRRMSTPYISMKKLMDSGAIGDVYLIRVFAPGDCLSDGTHSIDSVSYLLGNAKPESIVSHANYACKDDLDGTGIGKRFGHLVESGTMSIITYSRTLRFELFSGDTRVHNWDQPFPGWAYQDVEVFGTKGRLWRCGDSPEPPIKIWDDQPGGWRAAPLCDDVGDTFKHVFREFADTIHTGKPHPMGIETAALTHEILMGIYESARLNKVVTLPVQQDRYPLELVFEQRKKQKENS